MDSTYHSERIYSDGNYVVDLYTHPWRAPKVKIHNNTADQSAIMPLTTFLAMAKAVFIQQGLAWPE